MFQAAGDTHRGVMDRFRALPMSRAAVPLGQALADVLVTAAGTVPFLLVGLAVGWRIEGRARGGRCVRAVAAVPVRGRVDRHLPGPPDPQRGGGRASWAARPSCCRCCPTRTSRPRGCPAGCARSPSGTRSARSPRPCATSSGTRPCPREPPGRSPIPSPDRCSGAPSCSRCSCRSRSARTPPGTGDLRSARGTGRTSVEPGREAGHVTPGTPW